MKNLKIKILFKMIEYLSKTNYLLKNRKIMRLQMKFMKINNLLIK